MRNSKPEITRLLTTASALVIAALLPVVARAQSQATNADGQAEQAQAQEIVVTGSRITRRDFTSNTPIVTLDAEKFQNNANVAVEATLNKLPQFSPDQQMIGSSNTDIAPSPTHTPGISTANLRNLGPNRNLVLVDGRRQMPVNGLMVVDLNSIPSAMIDHVETITGGASAVYGPDAVSGVVNFILKKNYQGLTLDTQYGEAEVGDDQEFKLSALMGTNFADDRGNVTIGFEHYTRSAAYYDNREFYQKGWADPTVRGPLDNFGASRGQGFYVGFANNTGYDIPNPGSSVGVDPVTAFGWSTPNVPLVESRWANYAETYYKGVIVAEPDPAEIVHGGPTPQMYFNNDGTLYPLYSYGSGLLLGSAGKVGPTAAYKGSADGTKVAYAKTYDTVEYNLTYPDVASRQAAGPPPIVNTLKWNDTYGQLLAPLERYSSFASGHYDLTDNLSMFMQGSFSTDTNSNNTDPADLNYAPTGSDILVPNFNDTSSPNTPPTAPPAGALYPTYPVTTFNGLPILGCASTDPASASAKTCSVSTTETLGIHFPVPAQLSLLLNHLFNNPSPKGAPANAPPGSENLTDRAAGTVGQSWDLELYSPYDGSLFPRRILTDRLTNYQFTLGFDGKLPAIDWTWELFASFGQSESSTTTSGNINLQALRESILYTGVNNNLPGDVASEWGAGAVITGNQLSTKSPGAYGATVTCTSGWYDAIFHNGTLKNGGITADCINAVLVTSQTDTILSQNIVEFDAQGHLFDLPAGEVRGSVGASYRDDSLSYTTDSLAGTNGIVDQIVGQIPTASTSGSIGAREGYGELLVPVLKDLPLVKRFSLDLGARFSTYTDTGNGWTYMATGDWQVLDWLRFRGGYNLAVRAPSVGEAFQAKANTTPATDNDPCSMGQTNSTIGATAADPAAITYFLANDAHGLQATQSFLATLAPVNTNGLGGAETTYAICRAQMGVAIADIAAAGLQPAGGAGLGPIGSAAQVYYNTNPGHIWYASAPPSNTFLQGNPDLKPEIGKTWTAGVVLTSPFKNPLLQRATLSIDWYSIIMSHTINATTATQLAAQCYQQNIGINNDGTGAIDPALLQKALANPACALTPRNPANGNWDSISLTYQNLGYLKTEGVDAQFDWGADFADIGLGMIPGSFNVSELATYLMHFITNCNPSDPTLVSYDWAGSSYNNGCGSAGTLFRYQTNTTLTYIVGPATVSLNWRHLPGFTSGSKIEYRVNSASGIASLAPDADAPYTTFWAVDPGSHDEFDLSATYAFSDRFTVRGGVDNLLDAQPEITGANTGGFSPGTGVWRLPTDGEGTTDAQIYDTLGRRYYFGITAKF